MRRTGIDKKTAGLSREWLAAGLAGIAAWVQASPSGLNNTPTADTCPEQTAVFQTWEGFGGGDSENWIGVKYGLFKNAEIGTDWRTSGSPYLEPQFQAKYGVDIGEALPRLCVGIANLSASTGRNGDPMPYGVLTYSLKDWCRLHAGYGFQNNNEGAFGGIDRTFKVAGMNLMLCGDVIQSDERENALMAPGIKIGPAADDMQGIAGKILRHIVFETWTTFDTNGDADTYVAKLNLIVGF